LNFIERFKEKLDSIKRDSDQSRFQACSNISTDIIRTSEFVGYPEGIFIGEFFESLFSNIVGVVAAFKISEEEIRPVKKEIDELIELLVKSLPTDNVNVKSEIYDKMVKVRNLVTEFQIRNFREGVRKKGRRGEPLLPTISIEEE
jgi:phage-related minor tail protein